MQLSKKSLCIAVCAITSLVSRVKSDGCYHGGFTWTQLGDGSIDNEVAIHNALVSFCGMAGQLINSNPLEDSNYTCVNIGKNSLSLTISYNPNRSDVETPSDIPHGNWPAYTLCMGWFNIEAGACFYGSEQCYYPNTNLTLGSREASYQGFGWEGCWEIRNDPNSGSCAT